MLITRGVGSLPAAAPFDGGIVRVSHMKVLGVTLNMSGHVNEMLVSYSSSICSLCVLRVHSLPTHPFIGPSTISNRILYAALVSINQSINQVFVYLRKTPSEHVRPRNWWGWARLLDKSRIGWFTLRFKEPNA